VVDPRPATAADLPAIREIVAAAYVRYLSRMDRPPAPLLADYDAAVRAGQLSLYTNEVMTENQAIYTHLGYREVDRHTEGGYRRVFMEKLL
jgi:hypothetical protein